MEYFALRLLSSLINIYHSTTAYFLSHTVDTRRPTASAADRVANDHFPMSQSQDGGLSELLLADACLTNHSEAASL